jgi:D-2-hydroxyacid dehydrogenase (NADP+)
MYRAILLAGLVASILPGQTKKIVVRNPDPLLMKTIEGASPKVRIVPATPENFASEAADADAVIGDMRAEEVRAAKNLKWVQTISAGVERSLHLSGGTDLRDSNVVLTNNQVVQGPEIADHAMAMLLSLTRRITMFTANRSKETWQRGGYDGIELNGKNAVIIGVGGIGTQIALRAWAFGMNVVGVDPGNKPFLPFVKKIVKPDQLDEVIPQADVVFISAPHTPESHKMMGSKQFEMMKPNSYFIAVSRGGLYDMGALVKALDSRRLAGAGVDVTDPEPLPPGHPLWKFENAIITPHVAGQSDHSRERMYGTIRENIIRFADGKPMINVVDKKKGY